MTLPTLVEVLREKVQNQVLLLDPSEPSYKGLTHFLNLLHIPGLKIRIADVQSDILLEDYQIRITGDAEFWGVIVPSGMTIRSGEGNFVYQITTTFEEIGLEDVMASDLVPYENKIVTEVLKKTEVFVNADLLVDSGLSLCELKVDSSDQTFSILPEIGLHLKNVGFLLSSYISPDSESGVSDSSLSLFGELQLGQSSLRVSLQAPIGRLDREGLWFLSLQSDTTLAKGLEDLADISGINFGSIIPQGLLGSLIGGIILRELAFQVDLANSEMLSLNFHVSSEISWAIVGDLKIEQVGIKGLVLPTQKNVALTLYGSISLRESEPMTIYLEIPDLRGDWKLLIDNTKRDGLMIGLPDLKQLFTGTILDNFSLPAGLLTTARIHLREFEFVFNPFEAKITSIKSEVSLLLACELFPGFTIDQVTMSLSVYDPLGSNIEVLGGISGRFLIGDTEGDHTYIDLEAYKEKSGWYFSGGMHDGEKVTLNQMQQAIFPGIPLPEGLTAELSNTNLTLFLGNAEGNGPRPYRISFESSAKGTVPFGAGVLTTAFYIAFSYEKKGSDEVEITLNLEAKTDTPLIKEATLREFKLEFSYIDKKGWEIKGDVDCTVLEKDFKLSASYTTDKETQKERFQLLWTSDAKPLIEVKDVFLLNVTNLALSIERGKGEQGKENKWDFTATSDFKLFDPTSTADPREPFFEIKKGTLSLLKDDKKTELKFKGEETKIKPLVLLGEVIPRAARDNIMLGLEELHLIRTEKGWDFGITSYLALTQPEGATPDPFFDMVNTLFGKPRPERKIKSTIGYSAERGVNILIENDFGLVIPDLLKMIELDGKPLAEVGESYLCLSKFSIATKPKASLKLTMGLGLPSKLNQALFKNDSVFNGLFNTYNPDKPAETQIELSVGLDLNNGDFTGSIEKLDILNKAIVNKIVKQLGVNFEKGYKEESDYINIDFDYLLDEEFQKKIDKRKEESKGSSLTEAQLINEVRAYGGIRLKKPTLSLSVKNKSFRAAGGFEIIGDKLMIPFLPLRKLLLLMQLPEVEKYVPQGIPIRSIDFFTVPSGETERKLNLGDLEKYLKSLLPEEAAKTFTLPKPFRQILEDQIGSVANRLPERFKEYLGIHLPQNFNFEFNLAPDMTVSIIAEVEKPKEAGKDFKDYIQLLLPVGPSQLGGIRLRKFGLGTALGNQALRLDLSAEADMFDLVTLGSSLILPDKGTAASRELKILLPDRKKFRQTFEVKDLILFIIKVQAGPVPVPIPVPVYMSKLNAIYGGLEGTEAEFLGELHANLDFAALLKELVKLPGFFTKTNEYLEVNPYPLVSGADPNGLAMTVSPFYLQLPGFMGYETRNNKPEEWHNILIGTKDSFTVSLLELIKLGMNTTKGLILETVKRHNPQAINHPVVVGDKRPLNYFIEYLPLKHRMSIKKIKLFFLFDLHLAWAYATPDEFADVVYPQMLEAYGKATDDKGKKLPAPQQASPANYLLDLLVKEDDISLPPGEDQGVVLFLRGGLDIAAQIVLESAIGLSVSERKGMRTGIAIKGKVFDWIETESFFFIKFNPNSQKEFIKVLGSTFLKVFDREVLKGQIEVSPGGMSFTGMLDAFPPDFPIQLKGFAQGKISKDEFSFIAAAGLRLGQFKASVAVALAIDKGGQKFLVDIAFANATFKLDLKRDASGSSSLTRTKMEANVFNLLALNGTLDIKREPQRLSLVGNTSLHMPALNILRLEMSYAGEINTTDGFIAFSAALSNNSFILSPNCRPSGGVAFNAWFSGEHAGDFVLCIGGYHPSFQIPRHYPVVPPLAIYWPIDHYTHISGEAYFALTPNAIMAGARLTMRYHRDNVQFWFSVHAHFLCQWNPVYYEVSIGVSIGAAYTVWVLKWSITIQVSVSATLELWGPPTGGIVEVHLPIVRISVPFGEPRKAPQRLGSWADFKRAFIPDEILRLNPDSGVISANEKGWIVRPDEFSYTITTAVPVGSVNVRALNRRGIQSTLNVKIKKGSQEIDLIKRELRSSVPAALWGDPEAGSNELLDSSKSLIRNVVTGFYIPTLLPRQAPSFAVPEKNLAYDEMRDHKLPDFSPEHPPDRKQPNSISELQTVIRSSKQQRKQVWEDLIKLGLTYDDGYGLENEDLDNLDITMQTEWMDCPSIISKA